MTYDKVVRVISCYEDVLLNVAESVKAKVRDILIRADKPIVLCCGNQNYYLMKDGGTTYIPNTSCIVPSQDEIDSVFYRLCGYSVYSHMDEIRNGFIAVERSLRVGISGTAVVENGTLKTVRSITGLSVRVPREVVGCAEALLQRGVQPEYGVLIVGAPSSGKTTLLRDLARVIGNKGRRAVVLDERFELQSFGFDLGVCTDVLQGYPKEVGFSHALRCLSPEFILCDELGDHDLPSVQAAAFAGVSLIATVHAGCETELKQRPICKALLESGIFRYIVLLNRQTLAGCNMKIIRVEDLLEERDNSFDHPVRISCRAM